MSGEARVRSTLQIVNGNLKYQPKSVSFNPDVAGTKGPVPGAIAVTTAGTDVDFGELTTPALCKITNLDSTNFVEYGIWDPEGNTFYPLGELLAGESYVLRLSRNLQEEFGTASGTIGANTNRLRLKADAATLNASVEAFEL